MRLRFKRARLGLLILLVVAASAVAALPGSSAKPAASPSPGKLSEAVGARPAAPAAPPRLKSAARGVMPIAPLLLQVSSDDAVSTFAAGTGGCGSAQTSFNLGDTVCAEVSGPLSAERVLRRIQLVDPNGFVVDSIDLTENPQTVTFTLPTDATYSYTGFDNSPFTLDNRGTWRVNLVETEDAGVRVSAPITVHDPAGEVADLQISKFLTGASNAAAGANIQSVIWVFNNGPDAAQNVTVTDATPANASFQSLTQTDGPTFACTTPAVNGPGTSTCTLSSLANGAVAGFLVTYKVNDNLASGTDLTSSSTVSTDTDQRATADNTSTETVPTTNPTTPTCTMTCPDNITVAAAPGQSGAAVTFGAPALSGTCGTVSTAPASGTFFPIGSTVVTSNTSTGQSCSFVVTVTAAEDTQDPTISCPADITVDESSSAANSAPVTYSVTANDNSGLVSVNCTPLASGAAFPAGTTTVQCTATDAAGNSASCSFDVTVNQVGCDLDANSPPPTPNVASLPTITRSCSVTLQPVDDPTATDACGSVISGDTTSDRHYDVPGTYTVEWTYTDSAGHTATQNQTVIILPDNSAPVPDAASLPTVTGECFAEITGDPPTATDNCAGSNIVGVPLDPLSYSTVGTHVVRWQFSDPAGNTTIQTQSVVVTDTHAPTVTLNGPSSVTVECHTSYTDAGATAADNCSPAPTATVTSNTVNIDVPGTYQVVWSATDAGGNAASATRTVVVVDTIKPVITLDGANPIYVLLHGTYTELGATASDSCAGSFAATPSGSVNTNAIGTYVITYNATDPSGNAADPVTRTVYVIYDFDGFFSPINNSAINQVNAGRSVPVKFSLNGNQGLSIFAAGSPFSQQVTCGQTTVNDLQETGTAGSSSLQYDAPSDQYIYVWKTESSWAGTCRVLTVKLDDGMSYTATFKFK